MSTPTSTQSNKPRSSTYTGSCHCGQIKFSMKLSPPLDEYQVTKCNCSICHTNGYLMVYPLETNITWLSGKDSLKDYTFNMGRISHSFCPSCGTSVCGKSTDPTFFQDHRAVNVRTLQDVDVDGLQLRHVDGRNITSPGK